MAQVWIKGKMRLLSTPLLCRCVQVCVVKMYLEQVADLGVVVHDLANRGHQLDDLLGHDVGRCSLAAEDADTGHHLLALLGAGGLDLQVAVHDGEHVEVLALVLVDALDLDVVQGIGRHADAGLALQVEAQESVCTLLINNLNSSMKYTAAS